MLRGDLSDKGMRGALLAAMIVWGVNVPVVKVLTRWFDPLMLACVRMLVACVVLTCMVVWGRYSLAKLRGRALGIVLLCAFLMVYLNQVFFVVGVSRTSATNAALITALSPLVAAMLAMTAFREPLTRARLAGVTLGFAGVCAVVLSHPGSALSSAGAGDLILVGSVLSFTSGGTIVQRLARDVHPVVISWSIYAFGTALLAVHAALVEPALSVAAIFPGWWPWMLVLFSGALATAVSGVVWNAAIGRLGVARTSIFFYWVPVFGVAASMLWLREQPTLWHLAGFVAIMGGTALGTRKKPARMPGHPTTFEGKESA